MEEEESEQDALWRATGELIYEFPIDNLPKACLLYTSPSPRD